MTFLPKWELFSFWTKWLIISLICLLFQIFGSVAYHKNWNNCPSQSDALWFMPRVSLKECLNQCNIRNHCKLICYRTATKLCEIHVSTSTITPCQRCVSILQEQQPETRTPCDDCNDGKTCNTTTGICEYTECGDLPLRNTYGKTYGNLADVGAKKITECYSPTGKYVEITCKSTGEWETETLCDDICPSSQGIFALTENLQIIICQQLVTQHDAAEFCDAIDGALIKLDEQYKLEALRQLILSNPDLNQHDYWTDGHREGPASLTNWKFSDGSPMPMERDVFWYSLPKAEKVKCVRLHRFNSYLWNDKICTDVFHYICQMH